MKILLTDIYLRKSFDVINILKRYYPTASFIFTTTHLSFLNKIKAKLIYGDHDLKILRKDINFKNDLQNISSLYHNEHIVFIPIEESTTLLFYEFLDEIGSDHNFKFTLPDFKTFLSSINKKKLNCFCEKNQIPSPYFISKEKFDSRAFSYPIILKPKHGHGAKGIIYIDDEKDIKCLNIDFNRYFLQERLPNSKNIEAGFFLCSKGKVISFYGHKRIRTWPSTGGVSVFSKCCNSLEIEKSGKLIIKKLNWSGLIMIEFLFDKRDGKYKLIEINPRLWGSIMLSEFCGAKFLRKYIDLSIGNDVSETKMKENVFLRWIFPYDIFHWMKNLSNPFIFFKPNKNICHINFTYSTLIKSFIFVTLTYTSFSKITKLFGNGK